MRQAYNLQIYFRLGTLAAPPRLGEKDAARLTFGPLRGRGG
jgi:hypothetical protein